MKKTLVASSLAAVVLGAAIVPLISLAGGSFYVDSGTGFVGIGNTTPAAPLDVAGAMYSRLVTASSTSIDWNQGNVQEMTLTSSPTLTFGNPQAGGEYKLILNQDSTGGRTVTWPASVKWVSGTAPTLTTTANSTDLISFVFDGSSYLGIYALDYNPPSVGDITFDTATDCGGSLSCTVETSGTDRALIAFVHGSVGIDITPTCDYDGTSMTLVDKVETPSDRWMYGFLLINPSLGSHTLACSDGVTLYTASYDGVQQSSQPDNHATNSDSPATFLSTSYTVDNSGSWIIQNAYSSGGTVSPGSGYTARGDNVDSGQIFDSDGGVTSGGTTVSFDNDASTSLSQIIISLIPAPAE